MKEEQSFLYRGQSSQNAPQSATHILDLIDEACIEFDFEARIRYGNRGAAALWNMAKEELPGKSLRESFPSCIGFEGYQTIARAIRKKTEVQKEYFSTAMNQWIFLSVTPASTGMIVLFRNIISHRTFERTTPKPNSAMYVSDAFSSDRYFIEQITNSTPDIIYVLETDTAKIVFINDRVESLLGYDKSTVYAEGGHIFRQVLHQEDYLIHTAHAETCKWLKDHEWKEVEVRLKVADGSYHWFSIRDNVFKRHKDGSVRETIGIARDIHAQKLAISQLNESKTLLQSIIDTSFGGMALFRAVRDEHGQLLDLRYEMVNAMQAIYTHLPAEKLQGNTFLSLFPEAKENGLWERLVHVMETGESFRQLDEHCTGGIYGCFDQQYIKINEKLLTWNVDITPVKAAEKEARESAEQFRLLVENTPDVITRWDKDLKLIYANHVFEEKTGLLLPFMLGKTKLEIGQPDEVALPLMEKLRLVFRTGQVQDHYYSCPTPQGIVHYYSRLVPEFDDNGAVESVLAIARDISPLRHLEEKNLALQLSRQKELLQSVLEAQETERKRIAEDLHEGLGQLLYAAKLHLQQMNAPGQASEIKQKVDHLLTKAINQTRRTSYELIPITLESLGLEESIKDICRHYSNPGLLLECRVVGLEGELDKNMQLVIYRIAQELANNIARHAAATSGSLLVREQADFILIQAEDDGKGFDATQWPAKGLGLRSMEGRIKLLNGIMEIDSNPEQGTLVSVYLPK